MWIVSANLIEKEFTPGGGAVKAEKGRGGPASLEGRSCRQKDVLLKGYAVAVQRAIKSCCRIVGMGRDGCHCWLEGPAGEHGSCYKWHVTCPRVLAKMIEKDKLEVRKSTKIQVWDFHLVVAAHLFQGKDQNNPENSQKLVLNVSYKTLYAYTSCP